MTKENTNTLQTALKCAQRLAGFGVWYSDDRGEEWSPEMHALLETDPQSFAPSAEAFHEMVHPDDRTKVATQAAAAVRDGGVYEVCHRIVTAQGITKFVRQVGEVTTDSDGKRVFCGVLSDRSHEVSSAENMSAGESLLAQRTIAARIAHDFGNILNVLSVAFQMQDLEEDKDGSTKRSIERALEKGGHLTRRMVEFASGTPSAATEEISVLSALHQFQDMITPEMVGDHKVSFNFDMAQDVHVFLHEDALQNALLNLFLNARDACKSKGHISICAREKQFAPNKRSFVFPKSKAFCDNAIEIRVSDNGEGFPTDSISVSLEPFASIKPKRQGNGLGLIFAKEVALQADGALEIYSVPQEKTHVSLWLPFKKRPL